MEINAIARHIIRGQQRRGKAARNVYIVVMATKLQIFAEAEILSQTVRLDRAREACPAGRTTSQPLVHFATADCGFGHSV
jgi:hypothetical protein